MIKTQTCYFARCDGCGQGVEDDFERHFERELYARDAAADNEWIFIGHEDFCPNCWPSCTCGHGWGEHDYTLETPCESCDCQGFVGAPK